MDIVRWYGQVAADAIEKRPRFVDGWLMAGYELMTAKAQVLPDRRTSPAYRQGYALFMRSVTRALAHRDRAVLTSVFLPNEPFLAMGLLPVTAEAVASMASGAQAEAGFTAAAEGAGIPETYCSYHKVLMGMATSGVLGGIRMAASCSVACDANNLTFRALEREWGCARSYVDVPQDVTPQTVAYVADQLRKTARVAEETFGRMLDEKRLRELCLRSERTQQALAATLPHRGGRYLAQTMTDELMQMLDLHLSLGTADAERMVARIGRDLAAAPDFKGVNLVWGHVAPYFLDGIARHVNLSQEAQIAATDMMFDSMPAANPIARAADDPWGYMAERVLRNCFNGPAERRVARLRELADATHADGVVLFCHWGCKQTAGAAQLVRRGLEEAGYPVLVLDGDACDRAMCMEGQMSTRFSAFLEMLREEKSHG